MGTKLTIEYIKERFESKGWKLLTKTYKDSHAKLETLCPNGHYGNTITWNNFQRGQGCGQCSGNVKYTLEQVREFFLLGGCEFLDTEYKNNNTPYKFRCNCGNVSEISLSSFNAGHRCSECRARRISESLRTKDNDIVIFCESVGCKFINSFIQDNRMRIGYECKCGEFNEAFLDNFYRCPNCKKCGDLKKTGENCYRWNPDRKEVQANKSFRKKCNNILSNSLNGKLKDATTRELLGYTAQQLREHIENHPNMKLIGDKQYHIDHIFPIKAFLDYNIKDVSLINSLDNLRPLLKRDNLEKYDKYDPAEFEKWLISKGAVTKSQDIFEWLKVENVSFEKIGENRIRSGLLEIKYIDFSSKMKRMDNYNDFKECESKGMHLVTIYPWEWWKRQTQCCNFLKSLLHIHSRKIWARECEIKEIEPGVAKEFLKKNHIQGSNNLSFVFFGLNCKDELVGVMSLGRHSRGDFDGECILDRLCFLDGVQIVGGASKLFSVAKQWAKKRGYRTIKSFSDNRWSFGNVYVAMGFKLTRELPIDYDYYLVSNPLISFSKQSQKKTSVNCPENLTEYDWALQRGLDRVWNCGKKQWVYNV